MDILLVCAAVLILILSFVGCFAPIIPGPPIALLALLFLKFTSRGDDFSWIWFCVFAFAVLAVSLLDYFAQGWGAKKLGGTSAGVAGAVIGTFAGLFFMPFGIIVCPFLGAFIGELLAGTSTKKSLKSAFGTFVGFLLGTGAKLIVCFWITVYAAAAFAGFL